MNLDKLSSSLRYKVENRPTLTILKSSSIQATNLYNTSPKDYPEISISLPTNFDGKEVWKSFITKPKNQGSCGSCWSFASTSCLAGELLKEVWMREKHRKNVLLEKLRKKLD